MKKHELISLLNSDIENEHGAIIQYLSHAFAMGEGEISCEIEAIARDEMRHMDWIAEKVTELGGRPSMTRGKMRMTGTKVKDWMSNDVLLEEDAINPYKAQIEIVSDQGIKRLLKRILSDEYAHHEQFAHFVKKVQSEGLKDERRKKSDSTAGFLNSSIRHEYTEILQYLLHSYVIDDESIKNELQDQAINEMQHMGWLAEELVDMKGFPVLEHTSIDKSRTAIKMIEEDIKMEKKVARDYGAGVLKLARNPELKKLITRIKGHEDYHLELFGELRKKAKK